MCAAKQRSKTQTSNANIWHNQRTFAQNNNITDILCFINMHAITSLEFKVVFAMFVCAQSGWSQKLFHFRNAESNRLPAIGVDATTETPSFTPRRCNAKCVCARCVCMLLPNMDEVSLASARATAQQEHKRMPQHWKPKKKKSESPLFSIVIPVSEQLSKRDILLSRTIDVLGWDSLSPVCDMQIFPIVMPGCSMRWAVDIRIRFGKCSRDGLTPTRRWTQMCFCLWQVVGQLLEFHSIRTMTRH